MHTYTKKYIDDQMMGLLYGTCVVKVLKLSDEDLAAFKIQNYNQKTIDQYVVDNYDYQPAKKKRMLVQKENEKKVPETLKLVLSREGETDKFKSQFKTVSNEKDNPSPSCSSTNVVNIAEKRHSEESSSPAKKNHDFEQKVFLISPSSLIDEDKFERYKLLFYAKYNQHNGLKRSTSSTSNGTKYVSKNSSPPSMNRIKIPLREIERLHSKYFSKPVQDTMVIIANILNMISLSNRHHKFRMDESFKKKTEAEKLKERCDANRMHLRHKKVLEAKLKTNFLVVISLFAENEFVCAFQMFFLGVLTVLRVLDQPKYKKGSIFKNLVLLLWNSLKNSDFEHAKIFGMFRSKEFRPDCIDMIALIEDTERTDPDIARRMPIYFMSRVDSREHFQSVIDVLTSSDSNEDLASMIDNASHKSRIYSQFTEPSDVPLMTQEPVNKTPVSSAQNPVAGEGLQHWLLSRAPNTPTQPILPAPRANDTNHPRMFYESFSNSLSQQRPSEPGTGTLLPKLTVVNSTAAVPVGTLRQPTTVVIRPGIQNFKPVPTTSIQRTEAIPNKYNTIYVGNKQYQLVQSPSGQVKAVAATSVTTTTVTNAVTTKVVIKPSLPPKLSEDVTNQVRCFSKICKNPAAIMCSKCQSVKYCSNTCQSKDWYESHIHNCARLQQQNLRPNQRGSL